MPASLPASAAIALARAEVRPLFWLEVEGMPYAYGTFAADASFFAARPAAERRRGILPLLMAIPAGVEQEARPLDGTSSIGQLTAEVLDDDDGSALLLLGTTRPGTARLAADITAAPASLGVTGSAAGFEAGGGDLFVGRETASYTALAGGTFSGLTRGAYAMLGTPAALPHTAGDAVTPYPRAVKTRRAELRVTFDGTDAGGFIRWAGTIVGIDPTDDALAVRLTMESIGSELKRRVFGTQRKGRLAVGLVDSAGGFDGNEGEPAASTDRLVIEAASLTAPLVVGEAILVRIGDELVSGHATAADTIVFDGSSTVDGRGQMNTLQDQHHAGDDVVEVLALIGKSASGFPVAVGSHFSKGDHPLDLFLQLLLSRTGDASNSVYDTLPEGFGLGAGQERVDVAGIEALRDLWLPSVRHQELLEEPASFIEWVARTLRLFACYPVHLLDGRLTIRRMSAPIPGLVVRTLDVQRIAAVATWESYVDDIVGRVLFDCDYDPGLDSGERGPYRQRYRFEFTETQELYAGAWRDQAFETSGQWSGSASGGSYGAGLSTDADMVARRLGEVLRERVGQQLPVFGVECLYDDLDVQEGELVRLELPHLPNVATGARGLTGEIFEVLRKTIDDDRCTVTLSVAQTPYTTRGRFKAPSGIVATVTGSPATSVTLVHPSMFSGSGHDVDHFLAGDVVAIWTADLLTKRGTFTATPNVPANRLDLVASSGGTGVVAGDVVMPGDAADVIERQRELHAFLAGAGGTVAGGEPSEHVS